MANLNETAIHEDMKKCLNESTELERLAEQAVNYFKSKNFEVTMFDKNFFDFKGKCTNEKGQEVDSEGSFEIFEDGEIDYSVSHAIDGKEIDSITETISKYDKLEDAIDCIIAPVFEELDESGNKLDKKSEIRLSAEKLLSKSVSDDYASRIIDTIIEDVIEDINETADPEEWNEDDVRLAIGRAILKKFGEEI